MNAHHTHCVVRPLPQFNDTVERAILGADDDLHMSDGRGLVRHGAERSALHVDARVPRTIERHHAAYRAGQGSPSQAQRPGQQLHHRRRHPQRCWHGQLSRRRQLKRRHHDKQHVHAWLEGPKGAGQGEAGLPLSSISLLQSSSFE